MPTFDLLHHTECIACPLSRTRTHVVPGKGNITASLAFIGEAPGEIEDTEAAPWVGPAGQLLRNMIDAMPGGFESERDFFFSNIYQCRPPDNNIKLADGSPCPSIWLNAELQRLRPRVVVAIGQTACHYFRPDDTDMPMRWHASKDNYDEAHGYWIVGMRHPAAALYAGAERGSEEGNRIIASMIWSLQRAFYYLVATGTYAPGGDLSKVAELTEAFEEGGI